VEAKEEGEGDQRQLLLATSDTWRKRLGAGAPRCSARPSERRAANRRRLERLLLVRLEGGRLLDCTVSPLARLLAMIRSL